MQPSPDHEGRYGDDTDNPSWTVDSSGSVSRAVTDVAGVLGATTSASGSVTLQLADLHGDIAVTLATATTTATAYSYDEYGNTTNTSRYGWLGTAQRASDTPTGITLMGQRLYNPMTGRFLQTDPVQNGSATAYDYCNGDPVNCTDINGLCPSGWISGTACEIAVQAVTYGVGVAGDAVCAAVSGPGYLICAAAMGGVGEVAGYFVETRFDGGWSWKTASHKFIRRFGSPRFRAGINCRIR
ncbi:RHS repeat-associated core domain-containing protein [Streptomyces sp. NPDC001714]|uniref:RHS repeat-associated core domain-containing protein n=1 Tax=Streptomyces sp. NPDC001714 TaxID=3364603 RepID=UPI0036C3AB37